MVRLVPLLMVLSLVAAACAGDDSASDAPGPVLIEKATRADVPWDETPEFILSNEECPSTFDVHPIADVVDPEVRLELVAPVESASSLAFVDDGSAYIGTREGLISHWVPGSDVSPVLDLTDDTTTERDQGLLGLEVNDGKLFVYRTDGEDDSVLETYELLDGVPLEASRVLLMRADQPSKEHNGGTIDFGPDGYLYLTIGDGGGQGGAYVTGRDVAHEFGSILRLQYHAGETPRVSAAPGNPFLGSHPGSDYAWIWGLRHAYRFSFDDSTGDLWVGDVGQQCVEEVTVLDGGGEGGEHLGWNSFEGHRPFMPDLGIEHTRPTFTYAHVDGWCAVIGGAVYRGEAMPALVGQYIFGDFCRRSIVAYNPVNGTLRELERGTVTPVDFAVDLDGELHVVDMVDGVWAITQS